MTRLLCAHPGADTSTCDVYSGLVPALERAGATCTPYALNQRIANEGAWLGYSWRRARKTNPDLAKPTAADVIYRASVGLLERTLRLRPDWTLIVSGMFVHPDVLIMLRRAGVRTALLLTESPYDAIAEQRLLPLVDLAWTNERTCVEDYRRINPNTHYLPHAYDPLRHYPVSEDVGVEAAVPAHDVVFVGTGFQERIDVLAAVDWTGIDLGLYGAWHLLPSRHHLRQYLRGGYIDNAQAAALYRRAKIGLNLYRASIGFGRDAPRIAGAESLNPRALELAACGVFQISDHRAEVEEVFGPAVPTFTDAAHLERKIRWYLEQPELAAAHGMMAHRRAHAHTFGARAGQILSDLRAHDGDQLAA